MKANLEKVPLRELAEAEVNLEGRETVLKFDSTGIYLEIGARR